MSRHDLYERILASFHAAVFDDARWSGTSGLIDAFCGASGNSLVLGDGTGPDDIDIFFARFCFRGQRHAELEQEYFRVYHRIDERLPRLRHLPHGRLVPVSSLYSEDEKKSSVVYNELLPRTGTRDGLNLRLPGPDGSRIVWIFADPADGDGWSSGQLEAIESLMPHLRQFVRVRQALIDARALGASLIDLLDTVRVGVIRLDRRARVAATNDRARALLHGRDGLVVRDGLLHAALPAEDAKLQGVLADALPSAGGPAAGGSMPVSRAEPLPRLVLHVSPVVEGWAEPRISRAGALVLTVDPADRAGIDPAHVGDALGLTPAQSRVAVSLAEGRTIREIAVETGRSPATIKWHIRHIYARNGLSRRAELVQLVNALANVPVVRH